MSDSYFAHPTACIDAGAQIGKGTSVWHFCHVSASAIIGKECTLGQNVFVADRVVIGSGVKIQNNVSIYEGVTLDDFTFCGPSVVFTNVKTPRASFARNTSNDFVPTRVKLGASIGANATIVCGVTIHEWAFIGAGAVVTKDVPAYALMLGVPAVRKGWACQCGTALRFIGDSASCAVCERSYILDSQSTITLVQT